MLCSYSPHLRPVVNISLTLSEGISSKNDDGIISGDFQLSLQPDHKVHLSTSLPIALHHPRGTNILAAPVSFTFHQTGSNSPNQPTIIVISLLAILASPSNFVSSLAPPTAVGPGLLALNATPLMLTIRLASVVSDSTTLLELPQAHVLIQQLMGALLFSAAIEPLLLYTAIYRLESVRDAEIVIGALLMAFTLFDLLHSAATLSIVGYASVLPAWVVGGGDGRFRWVCFANVWVPIVWAAFRGCWFGAVGRERAEGGKLNQKED